MRIIDNLSNVDSYYLVISGNGTFPENILLKTLCKKYNGHDKVIFIGTTPLKKQTGLNALNALKFIPEKYKINSIIFMVDGEHIIEDAQIEIKRHLQSKGIGIHEIIPLQGSFVIKCKLGSYNFTLYCIILGPEIFIEEEVARLIEYKLGISLDMSQRGESKGRKLIKSQIKQVLRQKNKKIEDLICNTGKNKLEKIFPNICAIIKAIEANL